MRHWIVLLRMFIIAQETYVVDLTESFLHFSCFISHYHQQTTFSIIWDLYALGFFLLVLNISFILTSIAHSIAYVAI